MKQYIMVVKRDTLFINGEFEGFRNKNEENYEKIILEKFQYIKREEAETNKAYKQPIAYAVILNPVTNEIFAYQRSHKHYDEKRLHGKWSWGIGGHIEEIDKKVGNPLIESLLREIKEEVEIKDRIEPKLIGYINNERDDVSSVHFGLLFIIEAKQNVKPKTPEIKTGKMLHIDKLKKLCLSEDVEEWSKISLEPIIRYLEDKQT